MPEGYTARSEHVILVIVSAWASNCARHLPQRFEAADVAAALAERDERIEALEAEIERWRKATTVFSTDKSHPAAPTNKEIIMTPTYRTTSVDGLKVFYRVAGDPKSPTVLLLHV